MFHYIYGMRKLCLILFLFTVTAGFSQSDALANNYYEQGQFQKALSIYEKLSKQNPYRLDYFMSMIASNQQLENFSEAEKLLKEKLGEDRKSTRLNYSHVKSSYA